MVKFGTLGSEEFTSTLVGGYTYAIAGSSDDWLQDVAVLLADLGVGTRWTGESSVPAGTFAIFRDGRSKIRQEEAILLLRSGGLPDEYLVQVRRHTFQVLIVGKRTDPETAAVKAKEVYDKLHASVARTPTGSARIFSVFEAQAMPEFIGPDRNQNPQYSLNFLVEFREEA